MKIYTNQPLIESRRRFGFILSTLGLVMGLVAAFLYFRQFDPLLTMSLLLSAVVVSIIGTYIVNRWVRPPLAEPLIDAAFKRTDNRHALFHHIGPVPHLMLLSEGLMPIRVKRYGGPVSYDAKSKKWRGRFSLARFYLHGLTAETLGNPTAELAASEAQVRAWLKKHVPYQAEAIPIRAVALFTSPDADLSGLKEAPVPIADPKTLKRQEKALFGTLPALHPDLYNAVRDALEAQVPKGAVESS